LKKPGCIPRQPFSALKKIERNSGLDPYLRLNVTALGLIQADIPGAKSPSAGSFQVSEATADKFMDLLVQFIENTYAPKKIMVGATGLEPIPRLL